MPAPRKFKDPCDTKLKRSELKGSPVSSTHVSVPTPLIGKQSPELSKKKQRVYPNGNKGWESLQKWKDNNRERLKGSWNHLSGYIMDWVLQPDEQGEPHRLKALLEESKLKDIGVMLGISTEKVLLLEGQPTSIIGQAQQAKLDEMGPALLDALKKRGIVTLTERKATIEMPEKKDVVGSVG
jgi:hypothetical protein